METEHSALNFLLQSSGSICVKRATVLAYQDMLRAGLVWGEHFVQVLHVHDEIQYHVKPELAESVGKLVVKAIQKAGTEFDLRVPLDGEYKIGKNWAETH